jgi:hypothetical protein
MQSLPFPSFRKRNENATLLLGQQKAERNSDLRCLKEEEANIHIVLCPSEVRNEMHRNSPRTGKSEHIHNST